MNARVIGALTGVVAAIGLATWALVSPGAATSAGPKASPAAARSQQAAHPTASMSPSPAAQPHLTGMRMVFDQRFTGHQLSTSVWATCYPWNDTPAGCTNFGNPEKEWYLPSQDVVSGGALHLVARRAPTEGTTKSGSPKLYACRSGMITSYPSFHFKYGYVKIVARIPAGAGLWSGLWLAAASEKWPPEIDMLERWGSPFNLAGVYLHPLGGDGHHVHLAPALVRTLSTGWHTFALSWTASSLTWYIDGQVIMTRQEGIPHQQMYIIANLADYQLPKNGGCTGQLLLRSVQVWQKR